MVEDDDTQDYSDNLASHPDEWEYMLFEIDNYVADSDLPHSLQKRNHEEVENDSWVIDTES